MMQAAVVAAVERNGFIHRIETDRTYEQVATRRSIAAAASPTVVAGR